MQTETAQTTTTPARTRDERAAILHALRRFICSRPGFDFADYGDVALYRADERPVARARRDALELLGAVEDKPDIDAEALKAALRGAFSGRLSWDSDRGSLDYCAGQYYPTEYRNAACAVLASALWDYERERMPAPMWWRAEGEKTWAGGRFVGPVGPWRDTEAAARADLAQMLAPTFFGRDGLATLPPDIRYGSIREGYDGGKLSAGDWLRLKFRMRFGRSLASRWFR